MGQALCTTTDPASNETQCVFREWPLITAMFKCGTANATSVTDCSREDNGHLGLFLIFLASFLMTLIIYLRAYRLPPYYFSRLYVVSNAHPMIIYSFASIVISLNVNFNFFNRNSYFGTLMTHIKHFYPIISSICLALTTPILLFHALHLALFRRTWNPKKNVIFIICLLVAIFLAAIDAYGWLGPPLEFSRILEFALFFICIVTGVFMIPMWALLCSDSDTDPTSLTIDKRAKIPLILLAPFVFYALFCPSMSIYCEIAAKHLENGMQLAAHHLNILLVYLHPLIFSFAVLIFLPQHSLFKPKTMKHECAIELVITSEMPRGEHVSAAPLEKEKQETKVPKDDRNWTIEDDYAYDRRLFGKEPITHDFSSPEDQLTLNDNTACSTARSPIHVVDQPTSSELNGKCATHNPTESNSTPTSPSKDNVVSQPDLNGKFATQNSKPKEDTPSATAPSANNIGSQPSIDELKKKFGTQNPTETTSTPSAPNVNLISQLKVETLNEMFGTRNPNLSEMPTEPPQMTNYPHIAQPLHLNIVSPFNPVTTGPYYAVQNLCSNGSPMNTAIPSPMCDFNRQQPLNLISSDQMNQERVQAIHPVIVPRHRGSSMSAHTARY